ncbi:MAG: histidinol-phosphatase HisJ family protein [Clostridia bacterium]|jgi:histidinol-phosphatase (PHP family)|nr:histidinol-phosphatase HisJ family protein [Clostridia bacterium]
MKHVKTDYHVHPNYSIDASPATIKDYCYKAIDLELTEICFCTHVELDPKRKDKENFVMVKGEKRSVYDFNWLDNYFEEISRMQDELKTSGLKVKAGVEIGFCQGIEHEIEKVVNSYPFDYVLGAIHCLDHISISSKKESPHYFGSREAAQVRADYFAVLMEAVKTGLFDCIAHVDLYRRYGIGYLGPEVDTIHRGAIEPVFDEMKRRGVGLEINTSSRRRGLKEFHPTKEILSIAVEAGIQVFTVGSDAHSLDELGEGIDEALAVLDELNVCNHVFTRRQPVPCCKSKGECL